MPLPTATAFRQIHGAPTKPEEPCARVNSSVSKAAWIKPASPMPSYSSVYLRGDGEDRSDVDLVRLLPLNLLLKLFLVREALVPVPFPHEVKHAQRTAACRSTPHPFEYRDVTARTPTKRFIDLEAKRGVTRVP